MKTLTVEVNYSPKRLAEICKKHGREGSSQTSLACCPFPVATCPIHSALPCSATTAEEWEKVLQNEEPEPEFHFGDKVMICKKKGVFAFYEGDGGRFMVEGFKDLLFTKFKDVKSGWDNV